MPADYFLRSERPGFRTWTPEDRDLAVALWCDPAVTRLFGGPYDAEWAERRLASEIANLAEHRYQYWPIFRLADGDHVGVCGMRPRDPAARVNGFGFHLRPEHWGQGYATEASRAAIRYAPAPLLSAGGPSATRWHRWRADGLWGPVTRPRNRVTISITLGCHCLAGAGTDRLRSSRPEALRRGPTDALY